MAVFEHQSHWACLCLTSDRDDTVEGIYLDGLNFELQQQASKIASIICDHWGKKLKHVSARRWFTQETGIGCGTVAVAHAALVVGGQQVTTLQALRKLQAHLSSEAPPACLHVGRGNLTEEETKRLQELLVEKGVPQPKTAERLQALAQKVGATAVAQVLQTPNPWRQLKALASRPGQVFRLVLPEELEHKIREKASSSFGAVVPEGGRKKRRQALIGKATPALSVDPELLGIAEGSFVAADGQTMHQIKFSEVATEAHGLAFCTAAQAAPFLQGESLSTDPLCSVTTASLPSDIKARRPHKVVRFPAMFQPTDEPMLLTGSLVNLGDTQVELAQGSIAEPSSIATGMCKISVFRDELQIPWAKFCEGPVRWLMQTVPALKVCPGVDCGIDCAFFHPAVDEHIDQMVLDLWARQFQTLAGKKVADKAAEVFSVLIRVPQSAVDQLQMIQVPSVYVEPRADAGVGTHDDYRAIG